MLTDYLRSAMTVKSSQALVYQCLGIDWMRACPARKFVMK